MNHKTVLIALILPCLLLACQNRDEEPTYGNETGDITAKADPVRTAGTLIQNGTFPLELISNGKLSAYNRASLFFRRSEVIREILVENGDWVEKGELLAMLDTVDASITLEQAHLRLDKAMIQYQSELIAHTGGSNSEAGIDQQTLRNFRLRSGYADAELDLEKQELIWEQSFLRAPISGRVVNLSSKENNMPGSGKPFCELVDDRQFEVLFPVFETELSRIAVGQNVQVQPFAIDSLTIRGSISEINPQVDEHGIVEVKAIVKNNRKDLVEGMNVKVFIHYSIQADLIVPKEALVLRNNRQVVFSLKNGRSYWNYVKTEYENSSSYTISIVNGVLQQGDTLITQGNLNLAHDAELDFTYIDPKSENQ